jgi:hypothetical protein
MDFNNNSWQDDIGVEDDLIGQEDPREPGYPSVEDELCRFATRQCWSVMNMLFHFYRNTTDLYTKGVE